MIDGSMPHRDPTTETVVQELDNTLAPPNIKGQEPGEQSHIANANGNDEASRLRALATEVRDQDDLERDIGRQVSRTRPID